MTSKEGKERVKDSEERNDSEGRTHRGAVGSGAAVRLLLQLLLLHEGQLVLVMLVLFCC